MEAASGLTQRGEDAAPGFGPASAGDASRPLVAGSSKMLGKLGLTHNPFVDRTAEKSDLLQGSFYLHSDLQGFRPSETTYIFFGRRGSGKTTIRLMMMQKYREFNEQLVAAGKGPVFVVDLCRPGHMDECLKEFMRSVGADREDWDSKFCQEWSSNDLADCVVSFAVNDMMRRVVAGTKEGRMIVDSLRGNARAAAQFLLLAHLYTREDSATLTALRAKLLPIAFSPARALKLALVGLGALGAVALAALALAPARALSQQQQQQQQQHESLAGVGAGSSASSSGKVWSQGTAWAGAVASHKQGLTLGAAAGSASLAALVMQRRARAFSAERARQLCEPVRVADARPELIEELLGGLFSSEDTADRIRGLLIGRSAQQKLELVDQLSKACGYQGLCVFGDCFDEVGLLDPLLFPGALKVFAREVCKNEVLNQGRMHFFFPDARASLDLSTDRIVREARFDRHFVRDLTWSRFQLEDLAERRFTAAQLESQQEKLPGGVQVNKQAKFADLFKHVSKEDFSGAISKLATPRELMVFMTELLARVEAHAEDGRMVASQDMEIAVNKALEQSV